MDGKTLKKLSSMFGSSLMACWIHLRWRFVGLKQWRFFFLTKRWTHDLLIDILGAICLMELWVPGSSSCELTSSSKINVFSYVVAVTGQPLPLQYSVDPVSFIFWLSYERPSRNIQNSDALSDFVCVPTFFIKIIFNDSFLFVG